MLSGEPLNHDQKEMWWMLNRDLEGAAEDELQGLLHFHGWMGDVSRRGDFIRVQSSPP